MKIHQRRAGWFFVLFLFCSCNNMTRLYVNYGAEQKLHRHTGSAIRIYFDRKGYIYPDADIDDAALRKNASRLELLYKNQRELYLKICDQYKAQPYSGNWDSIQSYKDPLQAALIQDYSLAIDNVTKNKIPVFIIHGFNEHPSKPNDKKSCFAENAVTAERISKHF